MPPIVIVGAGPTGLMLSLLLAQRGVPTILLERRREPKSHPAAHVLNTRTMEVFRELGVSNELETLCQPQLDAAYISWVVTATGRLLGRRSIVPADLESILALSPTHAIQYPQNRLEHLLRHRVAAEPLIDFRAGWSCGTVQNHPDYVDVSCRTEAGVVTERIAAAWLIACDGAASSVRRQVGIATQGPIFQHMLGIYFTADLNHPLRGRESTLYWLLNPSVPGVLISYWWPTEWVLNVPYYPPQQRAEDFSEEDCRELLLAAIGTRDVPDLSVRDVSPWVLSARLADRFVAGRVLLSGDAAHAMPPTGGLGLNTGVQDAHNLAWKLALVVQGAADAKLLNSYESERRAAAMRNLDISVRNLVRNQSVHELAGVNVRRRELLTTIQNAWLFQRLPNRWQASLVKQAVRWGTSRFARLDAADPAAERLRQRIAERLPAGDEHYRIGGDLGGVYREGAIVPEDTPLLEADDPIQHYRPTTWPGARLPHGWLTDGKGQRVSTHDLLHRAGYTLLVTAAGRSLWEPALTTHRPALRMPVVGIVIGDEHHDIEDWWRTRSEVEPAGALLVRPDAHVAWRAHRADSVADATAALHAAFRRLDLLRVAVS